jgi:hypothetical protein
MQAKTATTAALHHSAYTFDSIDALLERYTMLREKGITPAVCIAHGVTTSMYYQDPDRNFVELQIDRFPEPDQATAYMLGSEYAADSVGPAFDPEELLAARRAGASAAELSDRSWALKAELPNPLEVLMAAESTPQATAMTRSRGLRPQSVRRLPAERWPVKARLPRTRCSSPASGD